MASKNLKITEGLKLALMFSLPSYRKRACGSGALPVEVYEEFIKTGNQDLVASIVKELVTYKNMIPNLRVIHDAPEDQVTELFSLKAILMYTVGLGYMENLKPNGVEELLTHCEKIGFIPEVVAEMKDRAPQQYLPFHTWYVILDNSLQVEPARDLQVINPCMVNSGVVLWVSPDGTEVEVSTISIEEKRGDMILTPDVQKLTADPTLLGSEIKVRDKVAFHHNWVFRIIETAEHTTLKSRIEETIEMFNRNV
ncbi:DUF6390 family protein [Patescibacteria group bacterium]